VITTIPTTPALIFDPVHPIFLAIAAGFTVLCAVLVFTLTTWPKRTLAALDRYYPRFNGTVRMVAVVTASTGLAWLVATLLGLSQPAVAAVACVLTTQTATHLSLRTGVIRIIATAAGLGVALLMFHYIGVDTLSVMAVVAVSLVVGYALGLGHEGTKIVPATSLIMFTLGGALTGTLVWGDMLATLLGVILGAIASVFAHPDSAMTRARNSLSALNAAIADLLGEIGQGTSTDYSREEASRWLTRARNLVNDYAQTSQAVSDALAHANFSTASARTETKELKNSLTVLQYSIDQVTAIARTVFDAAVDDTTVPQTLSSVLTSAADAFSVNAALESPSDAATEPNELSSALAQVRTDRASSVATLRRIDDTGSWLLSGSIIADVDRMITQLEGNSAALHVGGGHRRRVDHQEPVIPVPPPARMVAAMAARSRTNRSRKPDTQP
jgi:uncharacterized membrane protein YgaE (UPF0421/DUF939 family)